MILRREASQLLRAFAKARGTPTSIADEPWDGFSSLECIEPHERKAVEAYALIRGDESAHQLSLLVSL
ncbi:hypothetical protein [Paraburkholderia sp. J67]|uniref:hypothetical protein n=1 Tax=Paraburkholderia sp. J67 TaxID=2805435 RepID=UPI002ABE7DA5|nr:hypothetical protein [Paraburkholderia sp. J67]